MKKGVDYTGVTVCFFCHDGKGNVLVNKRGVNCRDEQGRWDIGGGSVEFGETIEDALQREIGEEYMTTILSFEYLGYRDVLREKEGVRTHWIAFDFKVLIDSEKFGNGEPDSHEEVRWFPVDALPEPMHSQFPTFFSKYKQQLLA